MILKRQWLIFNYLELNGKLTYPKVYQENLHKKRQYYWMNFSMIYEGI